MANAAVVIPARYKSTRFPGKPLARILGKPMILWVAELSGRAVGDDNVYVATDSAQIASAVTNAGFNTIMTSENAETGTDRVAEAVKHISADIYLNVQGDEPLLDPNDILKILDKKRVCPDDIINGYCDIEPDEDPWSVNIPKVMFSEDKRLMYVSRLPIPGSKSVSKERSYYKQVCVYAFDYDQLLRYQRFGRKGAAEIREDIEILRFLELGETVRMVKTSSGSIAVDIPSDILAVEKELNSRAARTIDHLETKE